MCAKSLQLCPVQPHELLPSWLLCPWNFPGKNTRVVFHALLQGTFLTQVLNLGLLTAGRLFYCLNHQENLGKSLDVRYLGGRAPVSPKVSEQ